MCFRMTIIKAYYGAFCLGNFKSRCPIWLQHKPVASSRNIIQAFIQYTLGWHAYIFRNFFLFVAKLFFKPRYHPKSPENLNFGIKVPSYHTVVSRHILLRLYIFFCSYL